MRTSIERELRAARLIPPGPSAQTMFKRVVCHLYGGGSPIAEAVVEAREQQRQWDPNFEPRFAAEFLAL